MERVFCSIFVVNIFKILVFMKLEVIEFICVIDMCIFICVFIEDIGVVCFYFLGFLMRLY